MKATDVRVSSIALTYQKYVHTPSTQKKVDCFFDLGPHASTFLYFLGKELENLAAMDLELQKIAEKFSGNRRG